MERQHTAVGSSNGGAVGFIESSWLESASNRSISSSMMSFLDVIRT